MGAKKYHEVPSTPSMLRMGLTIKTTFLDLIFQEYDLENLRENLPYNLNVL